ncbi:MAG: ribosome maturation factor RimM [Bacteroidota bacterium]
MDTYIPIGYTKKTYGIKGELKFYVEPKYLEDLLQTEVVFLAIDGAPVPYFIEYISLEHTQLLKFEEVDDREAALAIVGSQLSLREQDLIPEEERQLEVVDELVFGYCVGFQVVDEQLGPIGRIEEVLEYPQQEMASVPFEGRELLIPLNEQFIQNIDEEKKQVLMALPEGLLQL